MRLETKGGPSAPAPPARRPLRRRGTLATLAVAVLALAPRAEAGRSFEEIWRDEADAALRLRADPRALRPLHRLEAAARLANDAGEVLGVLESLRRAGGWDPNVRAALLALVRDHRLARGDVDAARAITGELGTLTDFMIVGPFASDNRRGHALAFRPEWSLDVGAEEAGVLGPVVWRAFRADPDGVVPLDQAFFPFVHVTGFALALARVPADTPAALRLGADDMVKVFHEGRLVFDSRAAHPLRFDQHVVGITLRRGWNRLLFKVTQEEGAFRLTARLTRPDGTPLEGVETAAGAEAFRAALAPGGEAGEAPAPPEVADPGVWLERRARERREDPDARADLAALLVRTHPFDRSVDVDAEHVRAAARLAPDSVDLALLLRDASNDPDERRRALERGLAARPDEVRLRFALARELQASGRIERAVEELQATVRADPGFLAAQAWLNRLVASLEVPGPPVLALERLAAEHPESRWVRYHLGFLHRAHLSAERATLELEAARSADRLDGEVTRALLDLHAQRGDAAALAALHADEVRLEPSRLAPRLALARLEAAQGRLVPALDLADQALAICPSQPELLRFRGELLHQLGRTAEAVEAWRAALRSRPQDEPLRERLDVAEGVSEGFETPYRLDLGALRERAARPHAMTAPASAIADVTVFRLFPGGASATFRQQAFLVYDAARADDLRRFDLVYTPGSERLTVAEARIVRADGTVLRAHQSDSPFLAEPEVRLYYDTQARVLGFPELEDGDLVEVTFVLRDEGVRGRTGDYFGTASLLGAAFPTEERSIVVLAPESQPVHVKVVGLENPPSPVETIEDGVRRLELSFASLPALRAEPGAPPPVEGAPLFLLSTYADWGALGGWYADLVRDALEPDEAIRDTVAEVTAGLADPRAKAAAIYEWVVDHTRYVGLEFGIHTIKPYAVGRTFRRLHGDCKDKAALLVAMLGEAGLDAHVALLRTRRAGRVPMDLPSLALFDHAIVNVPALDLWLDGTVIAHGPHELPWADRGMPALIVEPGGGRLTRTPAPTPEANETRMVAEVTLSPAGAAARLQGWLEATGEPAAALRARFRGEGDPRGAFATTLRGRLPGAEVEDVRVVRMDLDEPRPRLEFAARIPDPGHLEGRRLSLPLLLDVALLGERHPLGDRDRDLVLGPPGTERFEQIWRLPAGARVVSVPRGERRASSFGSLEIDVEPRGGAVAVTVRRVVAVDQVRGSDLEDFRRFCREADAALSRRIVLEVEP